jgi:hypothetical protein
LNGEARIDHAARRRGGVTADAVFKKGEAGGVPTWPCQAGDQASAYRVDYPREGDRNGTARLL